MITHEDYMRELELRARFTTIRDVPKRGDKILAPDGDWTITRYDAERELMVCTNGAATCVIGEIYLDYGDAILVPKD